MPNPQMEPDLPRRASQTGVTGCHVPCSFFSMTTSCTEELFQLRGMPTMACEQLLGTPVPDIL